MQPNPWHELQVASIPFPQHRYWSSLSQPYAAGDQLMRYLEEGWELERRVEVETHWFGETRHIVIYHFTLSQRNRRVLMRVLGTPMVRSLVERHAGELDLVPVREPSRQIPLAAVEAQETRPGGVRAGR